MASEAWLQANQDRVKKYRRDWYRRNRAEAIAKAYATKRRAIERNKDLVRKLKDVPCADCKRRYPHYVMQFDHTGDDKDAGIAYLVNIGVSVKKLLAEIAKCEIVCANCHAVRTWRRQHGGELRSSGPVSKTG